jgi:hypothetical protein
MRGLIAASHYPITSRADDMSLIPPALRLPRPPRLLAIQLTAFILLGHSAEAAAESAIDSGVEASGGSSSELAQLIVDWRACFTRDLVETNAASIIAACNRAIAHPNLSVKERDKLSRQRQRIQGIQEGLQQGAKSNATAEQR